MKLYLLTALLAVILELEINGVDSKTNSECTKFSDTRRGGRKVCKKEIILDENFNDNVIDPTVWKHEIFMPNHPDYEFVVFDKDPVTSFVKDGILTIRPNLLDDNFVRKGSLNFNINCTREVYSDECLREGRSFSILPPIQSARISTKYSAYFTYGRVDIRAKLPVGDWLIPEIWLEPKKQAYGRNFASGRIRIAVAAGNKNLVCRGVEQGSKLLHSGILIGRNNKVRGREIVRSLNPGWYNDFHNYTLIWSPDNIEFMVDGANKMSLIPNLGDKIYKLVNFNESYGNIWETGDPLSPFDQEFYLSIGLSAGGMSQFPDNCLSNGHPKPWKNKSVKGLSKFWMDRDNWLRTWSEESSLKIDRVTIQAL